MATMICVDNSEWMWNGDYPSSWFQAQANAVSLIYGTKMQEEGEFGTSILHLKHEVECPAWLVGMSQAVEDPSLPDLDTPLQFNEVLDSTCLEKPLPLDFPSIDAIHGSFPELDSLGTLADLQFGS